MRLEVERVKRLAWFRMHTAWRHAKKADDVAAQLQVCFCSCLCLLHYLQNVVAGCDARTVMVCILNYPKPGTNRRSRPARARCVTGVC